MNEIIDLITRAMLLIVVIVQFILLLYLFYINYKRFQEDKRFWKKQAELSDKLAKSMDTQISIGLKCLEESTKGEQNTNKS